MTKDAKREIRTDRLTMRVWTADDLLDELFNVYDRVPDELRARIPLKKTWVLDDNNPDHFLGFKVWYLYKVWYLIEELAGWVLTVLLAAAATGLLKMVA